MLVQQRQLEKGAPPRLGVFTISQSPSMRCALRQVVDTSHDLQWTGSADSDRPVLPMIAGLRPDVVVLEGSLDPRLVLVNLIRSRFPWITLVVLVHEGRHEHTRALRAMGADVVSATTSAAPAALVTRIRMSHAAPPLRAPAHMALSERQVSILMLIAEGNGTTAIARVMAISTETVRSHIKEIFRRLAVRDRAHAVSVGYRTGILDHRALGETAGARS